MSVQLRVHFGDDDQDPVGLAKAAAIANRPELAWRLREFHENWFAPRYLRRAVDETPRNFIRAIRYWEAITDDWRLVDFSFDRDGADGQADDFIEQLPEWGYCRSGIRRGQQIRIGRMADNPSFTALSSITGREHASRIARLFRTAGPEVPGDNRHRYAELLPRAPIVEIIPADFEEKFPFSWPIARQIVAASSRMTRPLCPHWLPVELWWRLRLGLLFYTGLRMGTIVQLRWSHVGGNLEAGEAWLKVPKEIIKTRKKIEMPLHAQLVELLLQVRRNRPSDVADDLLVPVVCGRRSFLDFHGELQEAAAVPLESRQSPHAWRRTHLTQMFELGAGRGLEIARAAADHADGRTTAQHYVAAIVNAFRLRLPLLF
jgi:integrase